MGCGGSKDVPQKNGLEQRQQHRLSSEDDATCRFDKILVRLDYAIVPKLDVAASCDAYVVVKLVDYVPFPTELFECSLGSDKKASSEAANATTKDSAREQFILEMTHHQFSVKDNTLTPVWGEQCMLLAPRGDEGPKVSLEVSAFDKDAVGKDDVIVSPFRVADLFAASCQQAKDDDKWHQIVVPCDGPGSNNATHKIAFSVRLQRSESKIVAKSEVEALTFEEKVIQLQAGDVSGGARAVLRWSTKPGNTKAFFWIPGLNASCHHVHVVQKLLADGWDVFTVDCRRMGKSKLYAAEFDPDWNPLDAHTTPQFKDYCEELDALVNLSLASPAGKTYKYRLLYGNSTGALTCATYLKYGEKRSCIDGLALNGPFFDWNLAAYAEVLMSSATLTDIYAKLAVGGSGKYVQEGVHCRVTL